MLFMSKFEIRRSFLTESNSNKHGYKKSPIDEHSLMSTIDEHSLKKAEVDRILIQTNYFIIILFRKHIFMFHNNFV